MWVEVRPYDLFLELLPEAPTVGPEWAPVLPWLALAQEDPPGPWDDLLRVWSGHCALRPRVLRVPSSQFLIQLHL
jgi:hypothetical protein